MAETTGIPSHTVQEARSLKARCPWDGFPLEALKERCRLAGRYNTLTSASFFMSPPSLCPLMSFSISLKNAFTGIRAHPNPACSYLTPHFNDPISKEGHLPKFQVDMNFKRTLLNNSPFLEQNRAITTRGVNDGEQEALGEVPLSEAPLHPPPHLQACEDQSVDPRAS